MPSAPGWSSAAGPATRLRSRRCRWRAHGRCSRRSITLNLSFLVFTFGSLLVAIQVAGGQYTPRIIATTLLRDNVIRIDGRRLRLHPGVLRARAVADEGHREPARPLRRRHARHRVGDGVPVPDRLRRPPAAPGQHRAAGRRVRPARDPERVSRADHGPSVRASRAARASGGPSGSPRGRVGRRPRRRPRGPGEVGARGRRRHRVRSRRRRLPRRRRAALQAVRRRCRDRRPAPARKGRARQRADPRAGPDLRLAHPGRHRHQGLVGGDQRSDDGRDGDRPAASPAAPGRPALAAQRGAARCGRPAAPRAI